MAKTNRRKPEPKIRWALSLFYALPVLVVLGICGYLVWAKVSHQGPPVRQISGAPFASVAIGDLKANLFAQGNQLRASGNDLFIEFRDSRSNLVDVGRVHLILEMKMPGVIQHSIGKVLPAARAGQYRTALEPEIAGDWTATLDYSGPRGKAQASFPTSVAP